MHSSGSRGQNLSTALSRMTPTARRGGPAGRPRTERSSSGGRELQGLAAGHALALLRKSRQHTAEMWPPGVMAES